MMKNATHVGKNRTGIALSPIDKQLLIDGAAMAAPSSDGDDAAIDEVRTEYASEGASIGTVPAPATIKGAVGAVGKLAKGVNASVFIDKLGERLAFERTGTRLYGALLSKLDASEALAGGPMRADLEKIQREELAHFEMLRETMVSIGADPTAVTPSADVAAVSSLGLLQVLGDPRMNLKQSLEAILVAELVDNDCWSMLAELARAEGYPKLAEKFEQALTEEVIHLAKVREWVRAATLRGGAAVSPP